MRKRISPRSCRSKFEEMEMEFIETVATTDEDLLERYLEGETISKEEASRGHAPRAWPWVR